MIRIVFLLLFSLQLCAVVAIKPREIGENPGMSGEVSGALETKRGNTDKDNYSAAFKLQYDSNTTYLVWGMIRGQYGEAGGVKDTNNLFAHLRYIEDFETRATAAEVFAQMEGDEFKAISNRTLFGSGLRWKLHGGSKEWGGLFIGLGGYFEYIGYTTDGDPLERNVRGNGYLAFTLPFNAGGVFTAVGYYQPKATSLNDYYVSLAARLEVPIYKQLYVGIRVGYDHDAAPAIGIKKDDIQQRTLFKYKF